MKTTDLKVGEIYLHHGTIPVRVIAKRIVHPLFPRKSGHVYVQALNEQGDEVGVPVITTSRKIIKPWDEYLSNKVL